MAATDWSQLNGQQLFRARRVFDVACEYLDRDPDVVVGALTTANDESTFAVTANNGEYAGEQRAAVWKWYGGQALYRAHMRLSLLYDHDNEAGAAETTKDSLNLMQQREMYGYAGLGSAPHPDAIARLMDPDYVVRVFCAGVEGKPTTVRHWLDPRCPADLKAHDDLTVAKRCQWVQGSEFPTGLNYLEAVKVARQLIERFGGLPNTPPAPSDSGYIPRLLHWSK